MARSTCSTGTMRTSAAPTCCTTRPDGSSGLPRRRRSAEQWPGRYADLRTMPDTALVALQTSRSDWHARRARVILQGRAAKGSAQAQTHADLMTMFQTDAEPGLAPARDVGAARHRRLDAGGARRGARRPRRIHPRLGDSAALRRRHAVAAAIAEVRRNGARRSLAGRPPVPGVGAAAPGSRSALADRRACWRTPKTPPIRTCRLLWLGVEPLVAENPALALERAGTGQHPARRAVRRAARGRC